MTTGSAFSFTTPAGVSTTTTTQGAVPSYPSSIPSTPTTPSRLTPPMGRANVVTPPLPPPSSSKPLTPSVDCNSILARSLTQGSKAVTSAGSAGTEGVTITAPIDGATDKVTATRTNLQKKALLAQMQQEQDIFDADLHDHFRICEQCEYKVSYSVHVDFA